MRHRRVVLETLLSIMSIKGSISITVGLVVPIGRHKYVNGMNTTAQTKILASSKALCSEILSGTILNF
jgi:hypothetical protein